MSFELSQFHFIRPIWLLALPMLFLLWLLLKSAYQNTDWEAHINQAMLKAMRVSGGRQSNYWRYSLLLGWTLICFAAAGPTWQKQPVPALQNQNGMVIVFDLSSSMLATDLSPNRLTQAKYKLIDILRVRSDGQTALIAYAGDAHTISPLTDDPNTIEALLPALNPRIMPIKGSNTESAIQLATQLFNDGGIAAGQILLITDGVTTAAQQAILKDFDQSHRLSILSIGSNEPSPVPIESGGFLRNSNGEIVITAPNNGELKRLAEKTSGRFSAIQLNNSDIEILIDNQFDNDANNEAIANDSSTVYDSWTDMGHWLALLLLPLAALCFRKGVIYVLPIFLIMPLDSNAFEWQDLWRTPDQQAQQLIDTDPMSAAEKFEREDWSGIANFQAKDYEAAAKNFAKNDDAVSHYNRGNALAYSGDLDGAIAAFDKAIAQQADFADAIHNKKVIETLKQQQEQQNESGENSENGEQQDNANSEPGDQSESQASSEEQKQSSSQEQQEGQEPLDKQEPSANEEPSASEDEESSEQAQSDSQDQQDGDQEKQNDESESQTLTEEQSTTEYTVEQTPDQLKDSSEQWLRSIKDDPSGLLRRKFQYQSKLRAAGRAPANTSSSGEERY